jgi:predicted nucleic acid-binding Zn ribbon protein
MGRCLLLKGKQKRGKNVLDNYIKFIRAHHFILAVITFVALVAFIGNKWIERSYDAALAKNAVAQKVLEDQVSKNADLQKQQDAREQQYQAMLDTLTRQNQTLVSGIVARNQAVAKQQNTDQTLPLSELAARQQMLAGTTGITSTDSGLLENPPAAIVITQKLEALPVLEQNVKDQQTVISNKDSQIAGLNGVVDGLNGQVSGLKTTVIDEKTACTDQIKLEKAKARKSKIKTFFMGVGAGIALGAYLVLHI